MTSPTSASKADASSTETLQPIRGARMGWLLGADGAGLPRVNFEGSPSGPLVARTTVKLPPELLQSAATHPQRVVLMFENEDPRLPLIIGLEQAQSATPMLDAVLSEQAGEPEAQAEQPEAQAEQPEAPPVEAHVDGKRVTIEGADEVVLKCGQASITLRRNGKIIIKGTYVETHATGVNRIKGGSVQVN